MTAAIRAGALGLASLLAVGVGAARAEEGVLMKNILGDMGLVPKEREAIHYRERAPLVLPPKMQLRDPAAPEGYASAGTNWPTDPDVTARKKRVQESRMPSGYGEVHRMAGNDTKMSPDELRGNRVATSRDEDRPRPGSISDFFTRLSPDELAAGPKVASADDEPAVRRTLTDPPSQFRKSATGGAIPRTGPAPRVDQQALDANPMTWLTRKLSRDDDE